MVVHVDHVEVDEAAARAAGPHAHVQVLHAVGRQREDPSGVCLQGQQGEAGGEGIPSTAPRDSEGLLGWGRGWGQESTTPGPRGRVEVPGLKPNPTSPSGPVPHSVTVVATSCV